MTSSAADEPTRSESHSASEESASPAADAPTTPPVVLRPEGRVLGNGRVVGDVDFSVIVSEYSDLQCPDSARAATQYFPQIRENYLKQIRYEFRDFPLDAHPQAVDAAAVARCAGDQGKFFETRSRLLADRTQMTTDSIKSLATDLGLDYDLLESCLVSGEHLQHIIREKQEGQQLGVSATPTFLISVQQPDGSRKLIETVKNPRSFEELAQAINRALEMAPKPAKRADFGARKITGGS